MTTTEESDNQSSGPEDDNIDLAFRYQLEHLPVLWILGKTGAGKSSLIQAVTGNSGIEIGNGFRPCTRTSNHYDFPANKPLLRFLDTRGLAEADYDAGEDIVFCVNVSHAIVIVLKAEDPEQSSVLNALKQIRQSKKIKQLLVVHTGIKLIPDPGERAQSISYNQAQIEKTWGGSIESVELDFYIPDGSHTGVDELRASLATLLPVLAGMEMEETSSSQEQQRFATLRNEVLWYCSAASASDTIPAAGLVTVPAIQARMLYSLAKHYEIEWDKRRLSEFVGVLGTSFGVQYASRLGLRQLVKLIPVYGQTVGAASAAAISFASTFALGRVACSYMFHSQKGETVSTQQLKDLYRSAFDSVPKNETNQA